MIKVKNLFHDYTGKGQYAVSDVSFEINEGEIFGFLGPSGAGKSTVQNIMTGLLRLQQGEVSYNGIAVSKLDNSFYNNIGVSFEHPNLYAKLTGYENLKYYAGLFNVPTLDPMELLDKVGLRDSAKKKAEAYSKGMKQRLVFARALINSPRILFLDEPTSGLDPATANRIKQLIREQQQKGCTIFLTTHNMFAAEELCDRVAFLNDGRVVAGDTPRNLKLLFGEKSVVIEYISGEGLKKVTLSLDKESDRLAFNEIIKTKDVQTVHSQEATLEQIFIKLTGRELA